MRAFGLTVLGSILACTLAFSGIPKPTLPPGIWEMKEAEALGKGALVLEERIEVTAFNVKTFMQIRILSAAGKPAAEFYSFDDDCYDIEGRTIREDGQVTPFTRKDMNTKTVLKVGSGTEIEQQVLVVPGVTDNCLVEISWTQSKPFSKPTYYGLGSLERLPISYRFPIRKALVAIPGVFPWGWQVQTGGAGKVEKEVKSGVHHFTLKDIAPLEDIPYSVAGARPACRILLFPVPETLRYEAQKGPDAYWAAVGKKILRPYFEDGVDKGRTYRAWFAKITVDLPEDPGGKAVTLLKRIDESIQNVSHATLEESAHRSKKESKQRIHSKDLDETIERGFTDGSGMTFLFWEVLRDLKLKPRVALVIDRDRAMFDRRLLSWEQFSDLLVGVPVSEKECFWFDPSARFAPPGIISADYQGTSGMVFDSENWTAAQTTIPLQGAKANVRQFQYEMNLGEDEDQFSLTAMFVGLPEYQERRKYLALGLPEQNRRLVERLEKAYKGIAFSGAKVEHVTDPRMNVSWHVEGRIEREPSRRRIVDPFPANGWAYWIPDHLEAQRQDGIVFPHAGIFQEFCHFKIPKGYVLHPVDPLVQTNAFGTVKWFLEWPAEGECKVVVQVIVEKPLANSGAYEPFKTFLEWVREACGRTLILERS